ncbi:protein kinase domain-containing protein [Streptomyces erythrochromogenes]|uniref:serine/threonine-protein kinase n=1 Tax=Streptomyces erythrochromogenes TaxID=285574 RepID=UPI003869EEF5|nr:protein kinase [Streptomyces erythrochromogenes]
MGEVFAGRYELIDPIGRGGAGAVWRAWDHRRRRYVAAKVLLQSDAHTLLRFVREQALRIDHPHVLAPASWAADDDKVLFTMDLVGGGSLGHVIGDYGPLPPRFVCTLLDQLLSGLAAVHAEGVVHRDIKPANILMEATGSGRPHLRLSDFGISMRKGEPRLTETDYVVGTPGYFAPEQLTGAEPDFAADLFAVGLVALYLLQGSKPDSRALVDHFLAHGTPGAPQGVPGPLWDVVANLLQPDPQNRFRTATGARKALAGAVELLPPTTPDEDPVEVFDQLGALPPGFGPDGPTGTAPTGTAPTASGAPVQPPTAGAAATGGPSVTPATEPVRTDPRTDSRTDPRAASAPSATAPPVPQQAAPAAVHAPPYGPSYGYGSMPSSGSSETGSFHLPPPAAPGTPGAATAAVQAVPAAAPPGRRGGIAPPPPKAVASLLAAALLCFAVGVWALTQM